MCWNYDQRAKQAIDYVAGLLSHDNFELIMKIVRSKEEEAGMQNLEKIVNTLDAFLKGRHENYLGTCCFTKPNFAFNRTKTTTDACSVCELPIKVMDCACDDTPITHFPLMQDCREKIELHVAHRVRVKN